MKKLILALMVSSMFLAFGLVAKASDVVAKGVITGSVVNVRSTQNTNSNIISQLKEKAIIDIYKIYGEWVEVKINGKTGFVYKKYVNIRTNEGSRSGDTIEREISTSNIIDYANKFLGVKYVSGGNTPKGFDCSGFTKYVFANFDISLNRVASDQAKQGTYVSKDNLMPGDLVFFSYYGSKSIDHVGIYAGNGKFIHSPRPGKTVCYEQMSNSYYAKNYVTARRIVK